MDGWEDVVSVQPLASGVVIASPSACASSRSTKDLFGCTGMFDLCARVFVAPDFRFTSKQLYPYPYPNLTLP